MRSDYTEGGRPSQEYILHVLHALIHTKGVLQWAKLICDSKKSGHLLARGGVWIYWEGAREDFLELSLCSVSWGLNYMGAYIFQNSNTVHLRFMHFIICKTYVKRN